MYSLGFDKREETDPVLARAYKAIWYLSGMTVLPIQVHITENVVHG